MSLTESIVAVVLWVVFTLLMLSLVAWLTPRCPVCRSSSVQYGKRNWRRCRECKHLWEG